MKIQNDFVSLVIISLLGRKIRTFIHRKICMFFPRKSGKTVLIRSCNVKQLKIREIYSLSSCCNKVVLVRIFSTLTSGDLTRTWRSSHQETITTWRRHRRRHIGRRAALSSTETCRPTCSLLYSFGSNFSSSSLINSSTRPRQNRRRLGYRRCTHPAPGPGSPWRRATSTSSTSSTPG